MKRFKKIYIEITNVCNLNCTFCPKTTRQASFMDLAAFKHIIEEISPYTDYIYLHLLGEPFLHPELLDILNISFQNKLKVNITTNGTLINNVKNILLNSPAVRQINFSLHSFDANVPADSIEDYINNILDFIVEAQKNTSIINSLRLWNLPSDDNISNDYDLSSNKLIYNIIHEKFKLSENSKNILLTEGGLKLAQRTYLNLAKKFEWPDTDIDVLSSTGFCYGLRDQLGILVDGTIVPCCLDNEGTINLGNIFNDSLQNILNTDRVKSIFDGFSQNKITEDLCKKCGYRHRFSN